MKNIFDNIRSVIALAVVGLSFGFLYVLAYHLTPAGNNNIINIAAGSVLTGLDGIIGYYFGFSKNESDKAKTDQINKTGVT